MAQETVFVELDFGKHTINEPRTMRKLIAEVFSKAGLSGRISVSVGARIRGSNHSREFSVRNLDKTGKKISFTVQSDGKDSKHVCALSIPSRFRSDPEQLLNQLYFAAGDERFVKAIQIQQNKPSLNDFTKKPLEGGEAVMEEKKPHRTSATKILRDKTSLVLLLDHIAFLFKEGSVATNSKVLAEIKKSEPGCWERSALKLLISENYLSEKRVSPKKSLISMTEKGQNLVAEHILESKSTPSAEDNLMIVLDGIGEEFEQFEFLQVRVSELDGEIEHVALRLEEMRTERSRLQEELSLLGDIPAKREKIYKALKIKV